MMVCNKIYVSRPHPPPPIPLPIIHAYFEWVTVLVCHTKRKKYRTFPIDLICVLCVHVHTVCMKNPTPPTNSNFYFIHCLTSRHEKKKRVSNELVRQLPPFVTFLFSFFIPIQFTSYLYFFQSPLFYISI